ncbi:MAG: hypothetical protein J0L84_17205, partial [Verrucomicrobia bacterium]|nr:hypothetical protein [Verrucomicrobiota bacterium]
MASTVTIALPAGTLRPEAAPAGISWPAGLGLAPGSAVAFQLAFLVPALSPLIVVCLGGLFALRRSRGPRQAFYLGLLAGVGVFAPQMGFLWTIFNIAAVPLWLILASFHAVFVLLIQRVDIRWGSRAALALAPVLWCGIEYFRSEVWWLRFSWFSAGACLPAAGRGFLAALGVYGVGAVAMLLGASGCRWLEQGRPVPSRRLAIAAGAGLVILIAIGAWPFWTPDRGNAPARTVEVAGTQLEFPGVPEVRFALARLRKAHPEAALIQLSEYTFDGPVPEPVRAWC